MRYIIHTYLFDLYKQKKLIILLVSIVIFSFLYYYLGQNNYNVQFTKKLNYFEALYLSIVTQSLLGPGDILPKTYIARLTLMIQVLVTIVITFIHIS